MLKFIWSVILGCTFITSYALPPSIMAERITADIVLDGKLTEEVWSDNMVEEAFTTLEPSFGNQVLLSPTFKILYDDDYLYFGCRVPVNKKEDITKELTVRDNVGNSDWVLILIDTYGNGTEATEFMVTAAGVQFDARVNSAQGEDPSWDGVWHSEIHRDEKFWSVEMRIPYAALRFPKTENQAWNCNIFYRCINTGEKSTYIPINPEIPGWINQASAVEGISNIKTPLRLSITPYLAATHVSDKYPGQGELNSSKMNYSGGADVKYGINDAFTLDMTLIPDFGQVIADDNVLNLSPFEIRFNENRPFFTEGLELFSRADLFYSRRVGGRPVGFYDAYSSLNDGERITRNPANAKLYNASKLSGRLKSGLGIGVFNAISAPTHATVTNLENEEREILTAPTTNYNVAVVDQSFKNNSYISLINTNVTRFDSGFHNANVTGTEFDLRLAKQKYAISGNASYMVQDFKDQKNNTGYNYSLEAGKVSGRFNYSIGAEGISSGYNINDLGYSTSTNRKDYSVNANYQFPKGIGLFGRGNFWLGSYYSTTFEGDKDLGLSFNGGFWGRTKNQWIFNLWTNYGTPFKDQFESRVPGQLLKLPAFYNIGSFIQTDRRKKLSLEINPYFETNINDPGRTFSLDISPSYRFNDKLSFQLSVGGRIAPQNIGFYGFNDGNSVIGRRDQFTMGNVLGVKYSLNRNLTATYRLRHYWTHLDYTDYYSINDDGSLVDTDYQPEREAFNFNSLNSFMEVRWRFATGSDLILTWQNVISGGLYSGSEYIDGIKALNDLHRNNTLSLRALYFLDAGSML